MPAALSPVLQPSTQALNVAPPHQSARMRLLLQAALVLAGLAVGLLLRSYGPLWARGLFAALNLNTPAALGAALAATAAALVIHEMGHLLAAVQLDFEILSISLGPLRLQWLHGKYALRFSAKKLLSGSIGAVPKVMHNWRKRTMWVVAAGPAATLAAGLIAACVFLLQPPGVALHTFWEALAQLNFLIFILGFIPNGAHAPARSDSTLFWAILQNGAEAREIELIYRIGQLKLHALRPSEYPQPLMDLLTAYRALHPGTQVLVARTIADWALDCGDLRLADMRDLEAVAYADRCDPRLRNATLAASACFDVVFRSDAGSASAKFAQVDLDSLFPPCFAHRARAARLLAMDRPHRAPAEIIRAQYALPNGLAYYDFERMLLEKIHLQALALIPIMDFSPRASTLPISSRYLT